MAQHYQLIVLFVLGFLGWSLFVFTLLSVMCDRTREIKIIKEIQVDLKIIRQEIDSLK